MSAMDDLVKMLKKQKEMGIPLIGRMPVEPAYAEKVDEGNFHEVKNQYMEAVSAVLPKL